METISLKLDEQMLQNVDSALKKNNYGTRTEFIRSAIRAELERVRREEVTNVILAARGIVNRSTTDEEFARLRKEAYEEFRKDREDRIIENDTPNNATAHRKSKIVSHRMFGALKTKKEFKREKKDRF